MVPRGLGRSVVFSSVSGYNVGIAKKNPLITINGWCKTSKMDGLLLLYPHYKRRVVEITVLILYYIFLEWLANCEVFSTYLP